jgi:hypothetical protein
MDLRSVAQRRGATVRTAAEDAFGWRWRVGWRGVELGAWNDIDGVAVAANIGPWDEWVGLAGHPPDPTPDEALEFALQVIGEWLEDPEHAERIARRAAVAPGDVAEG